MLTKDMGMIDWTRDASAIHAQIRALTPWPGTTTHSAQGEDIKILSSRMMPGPTSSDPGTIINRDGAIACGDGTMIQITQIQVPTGKKMDIAAAINGAYIAVGDVLPS